MDAVTTLSATQDAPLREQVIDGSPIPPSVLIYPDGAGRGRVRIDTPLPDTRRSAVETLTVIGAVCLAAAAVIALSAGSEGHPDRAAR